MRLRPTRPEDLAFVTALERRPDNREMIGQWSDAEHLDAIQRRDGREHWVIERDAKAAGYLIAFDGRDRGIYVKRILVDEKGRGTGKAALALFLDSALALPGVAFAWLMVRDTNLRAQAVYSGLGFLRFDPPPAEIASWHAVDGAGGGVFRMRVDASAWRRRSPAR